MMDTQVGRRRARQMPDDGGPGGVGNDDGDRVRVALVPWMVAGIKTHYLNVRAVAETLPGVALETFEVSPYVEGGRIERLPLLPNRVKANLRCQRCVAPLLHSATPEVVWTQTLNTIMPFLSTRAMMRRIPVVYDIDVTPHLLAAFGEHYAAQVSGSRVKRQTVDALHRLALRHIARVVSWSAWAARSFERDYGVPKERIAVIPPGVHLADWAQVVGTRRAAGDEAPRLLFVGADFERKGGDLLLDVYRQHFARRCELHLVTKAEVAAGEGVFVYRDLGPNDPALRRLYSTCDALVLPTRADCFSLAAIEAMAAELPVVTTAVGGVPEIVEDGKAGLLVLPGDGASLRAALEALLADDGRRRAMGRYGRDVAAARFDARVNATRLFELVRGLRERA
jgi:glycosyltransferase involved in cell wall biosynthesis